MNCPRCRAEDTRVVDSRVIEDGSSIRRRRACKKCEFRFSTTEQIEIMTLNVMKADGSLQPYDKQKIISGLQIALQKRPVTQQRLRRTLHSIEEEIQAKAQGDMIPSEQVGNIVMKHLKKLDKIAYIRFASVYHSFEDIEQFSEELDKLLRRRKKKTKS